MVSQSFKLYINIFIRFTNDTGYTTYKLNHSYYVIKV